MPDSLADVLSAEVGFDVCNGLYSLLLAHHGEGFDPAAIPEEHRNVLLVWQTQRVIGNNGFNGFFAADLAGDPEYRHMRDAYDAVGCEPAAAAVRRVLDAFPDGIPPADPRARLQIFGKGEPRRAWRPEPRLHESPGGPDRGADEVHPRQRGRVHRRRSAGRGAAPAAAPTRSSGKPDPAEVGSQHLPRWAQVAFHARCARQIFPLWEEAWPDAPGDYHDAVEQVIVIAELSAAEARPMGDLKAAAGHAAPRGGGGSHARTGIQKRHRRTRLTSA